MATGSAITGKLDFVIPKGSTWTQRLWVKDGVSNDPIDITGYTASMKIRPTVASSTVIATLTTENGCIAISGTEGMITLSLSSTVTAAVTQSGGVYDLLVTGGGRVTRLVEGSVSFKPVVTRT